MCVIPPFTQVMGEVSCAHPMAGAAGTSVPTLLITNDIGLVWDSVNPQSLSAAPEGPNPGFTCRAVQGQWQHCWDGDSTSA